MIMVWAPSDLHDLESCVYHFVIAGSDEQGPAICDRSESLALRRDAPGLVICKSKTSPALGYNVATVSMGNGHMVHRCQECRRLAGNMFNVDEKDEFAEMLKELQGMEND